MRVSVILACFALLAAPAFAQSPTDEQIPYQGVLSDAGTPVADGPKTIQFALSDSGGGSWTETATVTTTDGAFAHRLGSVTTLTGIDFSLPVSLTAIYSPSAGVAITFGPTALGATPTARFAQDAGRVSLPLVGSASTIPAAAVIQVTNTGDGDGVRVENAGDDGVEVTDATDDGVFVSSAGGNGFSVLSPGVHGLLVSDAGLDGIHIVNANGDGIDILDTNGDGISILDARVNGVYVEETGAVGYEIFAAGTDGFSAGRVARVGLDIGTTGDTDFDFTPEEAFDGINVNWAGGDGLEVVRANLYGVRADGSMGNYLRSESTGTHAADLTLGGLSSSAAGDNAVLVTDPAYTSSDLFAISNDAIVFFIDNDDDGDTGEFEVRRGDTTLLFKITENGTITPLGGTYGAENGIRIDDPTAPTARAITLPSVVSSERLVAFSGTVTTDGAGTAVVELPAYADAVASDFRYQLTVIGSFAQAIVGSEVSGNRFTVRTSEPGVKVSWRVEGARQDAWARTNAHEAVAAKEQPGTYVHPAAYGAPPSAAASETDPESEITPEGRAQLDREAEGARENERRDAEDRARRDAESAREASARTQRVRD